MEENNASVAAVPPISKPAQPAQPAQPIKTNNFLVFILSAFLLIVLSIAGFFAFQTQKLAKQLASLQIQLTLTPTASQPPNDDLVNWKTYTYDTFLIKLSSQWHTTQLKNPIQFLNYTSSTIGGDFDPLTDKGKLKIEVYKNRSSLSLQEYVDSQKTGPLELKYDSEESTKIDGIKAIKLISNLGFAYYVKNGDDIYSLIFGLDFNNYSSLADQILSTFKFINSTEKERVDCKDPRPEVCTFECTYPPPHLCGSDSKSYCTVCQACSNPEVAWYEMSDNPCESEDSLSITKQELQQGWYWGSSLQKKSGTPSDWVFSGSGSRSDCWHEPSSLCTLMPD
ncbi:hypothetical protein KJ707_01655 [Patescibacteria group bacterium]|nr:hypothetical protein [Patescibacteria group bacterium]MBU1967302.1 hypothetical protein [Patescibacteria group bacterium]MBU2543257.1 hypothetical protein [Patescibacteria group bacterium]